MARMPLLPVFFASLVTLATAPAWADKLPQEPGAMLRSGTWDGGVGTYTAPMAFDHLKAAQWPAQGWHRLTFEGNELLSEPVAAAAHGEQPAFLRAITTQIRDTEQADPDAALPLPPQASYAYIDQMYLRIPGARLREGRIPVVAFDNGTRGLTPQLDHRYQLTLQGREFAFSVRNGHRGRNGKPYGDGAHYAIEYGGKTYLYSLEGFGWDSSIKAIADVDGDGRPDFFINVNGSNTVLEAVLLSSKAKPGRNPVTASLRAFGC